MRRNRGQVMYMPKDGKVNEMPNPKTAEEIFAERIVELEAELAALKEKCRWRKYEDEPLSMANENVLLYYKNYEGEGVFVVGDARELEEQYTDIYGITTDGHVYKLKVYWRPLDLPEMEAAK